MPPPQVPAPEKDPGGFGAGDPPRHHARSMFAGRPAYWLLAALLAATLLLRRPECLLDPQFWAEDGTLFFQQAFNEGFWETLLRPSSGYQHLFPRLVAGLALLLPVERAPLVFNLAAFGVQLLPALYLLGPRMAALIPWFPARALAALLYVAVPASSETHVNLTNSQWSLALAALCMLAAAPAAGFVARALEAGVAALFSLTGPFSVLFLPLVAPRLLRAAKGATQERGLATAAIVAAGAAVQAASFLGSARAGAAASPWEALAAREWVTVTSLHAFYNAVFGMNTLAEVHQALPAVVHGLGLAALLALIAVAVRDRARPLLGLGYLAAATVALAFAFPLNEPRIWLLPQAGPRYFLFFRLFTLLALLHLAGTRGRGRYPGIALLATALAVGVPADFRHPEQPDARWADNVAVLRTLPAGSDFFIPVTPLYHGGMALRTKGPPSGPSPLERLRPIPSPTLADVAVSRPEKLFINRLANESFLSVSGWAIDGAALDCAGGVFIRIDGRLFPAAYGLPAPIVVDGRAYAGCGFTRLIPAAEIGPGRRELSLVALSRDAGGHYQPTPPLYFTTGRFFPDLN